MRRRMPSFDSLESRNLLSASSTPVWYDQNGNPYSTVPASGDNDPSLGAVPIMTFTPTVVYPKPGPPPYDPAASSPPPY